MTQETDYAMTHKEIGEELGISHQRVAQLEKAALKKIGVRMERFVLSLHEKRDQEEQRRSTWEWTIKYDRLYREAELQGKAAGNG